MQDITPGDKPEKRSIRDISISRTRKRSSRKAQTPVETEPRFERVDPYEPDWSREEAMENSSRHRSGGKKGTQFFTQRWRIWAFAAFALIVLILAVSIIFEKATVRVTPRTSTPQVDTTVDVIRNGGANNISYDVLEFTHELSETVEVGNVSTEPQQARGIITVYNNSTVEPFPLVEQTRFESPDGMIYRVQERVTIPGRTESAGESVPGSIEVEVVAEETGSQYNIGNVDLTLPGLEGTAAFDEVYAEVKSALSGGASDGEIMISSEERSRIENELKSGITRELHTRARSETPSEYIFMESLSKLSFDTQVDQSEGTTATVRVRGTLQAVVVNENALAQHILDIFSEEPTIDDNSVSIADIRTLEARYAGVGEFDPRVGERFSFTLQGTATLVWDINENNLANDLAGTSKKSFLEKMDAYNEILSAEVTVRPIWKRSFPDNAERIEVINTFYDSRE